MNNNWISIEDKLPKLNIPVLVCDKQKRVCVRALIGWWTGTPVWTRHKYDVTHWMPLPEPPTAD